MFGRPKAPRKLASEHGIGSLPPEGTYVTTLEDEGLTATVDMGRAYLSAALIYFARRKHNRYQSNDEIAAQETARIKQMAGQFGYEAKILATAAQQVVIYFNDAEIIVACEGSYPDIPQHVLRAIDVTQIKAPAPFKGKLHRGFSNALDEPIVTSDVRKRSGTLYNQLQENIKQLHQQLPDARLHLTGFSSGGAMATMIAARLHRDVADLPVQSIYTYGSPRFSNREFKDSLEATFANKIMRFEQYGDPTPFVPFYHEDHWVHCGQWIPMDEYGRILGMNNTEFPKDTLSRLSKEEQAAIKRGIKRAMKATEQETLAQASSVFRQDNILKHHINSYVKLLHNHLIHYPNNIDQPLFNLIDNGILQMSLQTLEDDSAELQLLFPSGDLADRFMDARKRLSGALNRLDLLHQHPEDRIHNPELIELHKNLSEGGAVPDHHIDAQTLSRARLMDTSNLELQAALHEYRACLSTVDVSLQKSSKISTKDSTIRMIDGMLEMLENAPKDAPRLFNTPAPRSSGKA